MVTDFKTTGRDSELFDILYDQFGKTVNKSHIRLLSLMIKAFATMRTVNYAKLAVAFGGKTDPLSSLQCIQHSVSGYELDLSIVPRLVFKLLNHESLCVLSMIRTNWRFRWFDINALVLAVTYKCVAFLLLFRILPKRANQTPQRELG